MLKINELKLKIVSKSDKDRKMNKERLVRNVKGLIRVKATKQKDH